MFCAHTPSCYLKMVRASRVKNLRFLLRIIWRGYLVARLNLRDSEGETFSCLPWELCDAFPKGTRCTYLLNVEMIARFFKKLIGSAGISSAPTRIPKSAHKISADKFSLNALKIIRRLRDHGFDGYVVGGAVRDLLLKKQPKDFDVVTDATPEQIRKIFRRSRIIGRRFQLVHVYFGPEIIEVSTFRATSSKESEKSNGRSGRVLRITILEVSKRMLSDGILQLTRSTMTQKLKRY